jgi:sterol desaturase/sphingolipid hydroxylase (fatty acid hydroxylase superfamily)
MDLKQRTDRFRQQYRDNISARYSGVAHLLFVFGFGGGMMLYAFSQVSQLSVTVAAMVLFALLLGNIGEYVAHKSLGHRKRRFAGLFYSRHSGDHHTFFTHEDYTIDSLRDLRVVLFPAFLLVAVTLLIALPLAAAGYALFGVDAGWALAGGVLLSYLFYEFIHLCDHLPDSHPLTKLPLIKQLRAHHRHHHDPAGLSSNFNVTLPISDWLLGTKAKQQKE